MTERSDLTVHAVPTVTGLRSVSLVEHILPSRGSGRASGTGDVARALSCEILAALNQPPTAVVWVGDTLLPVYGCRPQQQNQSNSLAADTVTGPNAGDCSTGVAALTGPNTADSSASSNSTDATALRGTDAKPEPKKEVLRTEISETQRSPVVANSNKPSSPILRETSSTTSSRPPHVIRDGALRTATPPPSNDADNNRVPSSQCSSAKIPVGESRRPRDPRERSDRSQLPSPSPAATLSPPNAKEALKTLQLPSPPSSVGPPRENNLRREFSSIGSPTSSDGFAANVITLSVVDRARRPFVDVSAILELLETPAPRAAAVKDIASFSSATFTRSEVRDLLARYANWVVCGGRASILECMDWGTLQALAELLDIPIDELHSKPHNVILNGLRESQRFSIYAAWKTEILGLRLEDNGSNVFDFAWKFLDLWNAKPLAINDNVEYCREIMSKILQRTRWYDILEEDLRDVRSVNEMVLLVRDEVSCVSQPLDGSGNRGAVCSPIINSPVLSLPMRDSPLVGSSRVSNAMSTAAAAAAGSVPGYEETSHLVDKSHKKRRIEAWQSRQGQSDAHRSPRSRGGTPPSRHVFHVGQRR